MAKLDYERICACALGKIFGYEPLYISGFLEKLGSAAAVFDLPKGEADRLLGPHSKYRGLIGPDRLEEAAKELALLEQSGCRYVSRTEDAFPRLLRECPDCPSGLYVRSASPPENIFNTGPCVAIVGTRDASSYGRAWTRKIVETCASAPSKPVIVSGLAFGIDITAHVAALENGLPTIAVLPCGIDEIYPRAHSGFAGRIASTEGCAVVTDYPPGTSPVAFTFVRRNRIIAGLCGATILAESKAKGGGLITCRLADSYGRDVFALPGRVDDTRSQGCNDIIKSRLAEPVTGLSGLSAQLGLGRGSLRKREDLLSGLTSFYSASENPDETALLKKVALVVRANRGICPEDIAAATWLPYGEVIRIVRKLETDGFICTDLSQRCNINPKKL